MKERPIKAGIAVGFSIIIILVCIGLWKVAKLHDTKAVETEFEEDIKGYTILVVNGEEYQIKDIKSKEYFVHAYEPNEIKLIMEDGTMVRFLAGSYTLKK